MARHPRSDSTDGDISFVSRWSRRKQHAREQSAVEAEINDDALQSEQAVAEAEPPVPEKTDADMPSIESLTDDSSVSDFFSPGVSEQLRKIALRKLFHGAKFNIRDGLDDYDEDFRNFASLGDIITSDMKHQRELALERERQALAEKETVAAADEETDLETATAQAGDLHASNEDAAADGAREEKDDIDKPEEGTGA